MRGWWAVFGLNIVVQPKREEKKLLEERSGRIPILLQGLVKTQKSLADSGPNTPRIAQGGNTCSPATLGWPPPASAGPSGSGRIARTPAIDITPRGPGNAPEGSTNPEMVA